MATVALSGIITPTNVVTATSTTTLTNKTLTGAVVNGTVGATTPSTGAFTTLSATGTVSANEIVTLTPTNVAQGGKLKLMTNQTANAGARNWGWINSYNTYGDIVLRVSSTLGGDPEGAGTNVLSATSTGLAVTGTLSASTTGQVGTTLGVGGATPSASGSGISFPATQSASTDANTLDDYEEGTFTPTLVGFSTAGTTTYSAQTGLYTKIGRQVTYIVNLVVTATTGTGVAVLGGFPFTFNSTVIPVAAMDASALNWTSGTYLIVMPEENTTTAYIFGEADDANRTTQNLTNETQVIRFTLTHFV